LLFSLQKQLKCFFFTFQEQTEYEDSLTESTTKFVPVCMDEFNPAGMLNPIAKDPENSHNDSGEFPDLLDSESNLSMDYTKFGTVNKYHPPHNQSSPAVLQEDETGLTFATLSGVKPEYSSSDLAKVLPIKEEEPNVVVARKSSVPVQMKPNQRTLESVGLGLGDLEAGKTEALVNALANEAVAQLTKAKIKLPAGTCLVPAEAKCETEALATELLTQQLHASLSGSVIDPSIVANAVKQQQQQQQPMTITIQYKIYPDSKTGEPQTVSVKRELADLLNEASEGGDKSGIQRAVSSPVLSSSTPVPPPTVNTPTSSSCDGMEAMASTLSSVDPGEMSDPSKETMTVLSASGVKYEIPAIVTGGYDLDTMVRVFPVNCYIAFNYFAVKSANSRSMS
jgi:hypothetical protein